MSVYVCVSKHHRDAQGGEPILRVYSQRNKGAAAHAAGQGL